MLNKILLVLIYIVSSVSFAVPLQKTTLSPKDVAIYQELHPKMKTVLQILQSQSTASDYKEIVQILKSYGVDENTPIPNIMAHGTKLKIDGIKGDFDVRNFGEIDNGKSVFRFSLKKTNAQNLKALIAFLKTGNYEVSRFSLLVPAALASDSALKLIAFAVFFNAVIAVADHGVTGALGLAMAPEFLTAAAIIAVGAAIIAFMPSLDSYISRARDGATLVCENGRLRLKFENKILETNNAQVDRYISSVDKTIMDKICANGGTLAMLSQLIKKSKSSMPAEATEGAESVH